MEIYLRLDERLLRDDKIRVLIRQEGYEGLGIYLSLLTLFRNYKDTAYQIPLSKISEIADWDLHIDEEKLRNLIDICVLIGLFHKDDKTFWSSRRKMDLMREEEARAKMAQGGREGSDRRWRKGTL